MSQVTFIFCAVLIFISCKSREESQLASENATTEIFTLKGHRVFRFRCTAEETPPHCQDWNFQELDDLLQSHPDYASYKVVGPALRDMDSANKDIVNVRVAMSKETSTQKKRGMQARINLQYKEILKLRLLVQSNPKARALHETVESFRSKFAPDISPLGEFRGQDWRHWLSAGRWATCALNSEGRPICWGTNINDRSDGHAKLFKSEMLPLKSISAGSFHICAITSKSEQFCWGSYYIENSEIDPLKMMVPLKMISAGAAHTCVLGREQTPFCWGSNLYDRVSGHKKEIKKAMFPLQMITVGEYNSCVLTNIGEPVCWGDKADGYREVVENEMLPLKWISAGKKSTCALTKLGRPVCWGRYKDDEIDGYTRVVRDEMLPLQMISSGEYHTCVLTNKGEPVCWGMNENNQTEGHKNIIKPDMLPLRTISAGVDHTCALTNAGKPVCWGHNNVGQVTGRSPEGYKLGLNVPEDVDLSFEAFWE